MNPQIADILERMRQLEEELEADFKLRRLALQADFEHRRVHFEEAIVARQKRFKTGLLAYLLGAELRHVVSAPFVYGLLLPMLVLDAARRMLGVDHDELSRLALSAPAGADGLVLFNRFYQPDLDLATLDVTPRLELSRPGELRLPLR